MSVQAVCESYVSLENLRKVIGAATIGNFVEWFDFAVHGFLATILTGHFFPVKIKQLVFFILLGFSPLLLVCARWEGCFLAFSVIKLGVEPFFP